MNSAVRQSARPKNAASRAAGVLRESLRYLRLWAGMYSRRRADVASGEGFGAALAALASCRRFSRYVEIGTAHGLGTTKLITDALLARPDDCRLWTVESHRFTYQVAVRNWRGAETRGRLVLIYGAATGVGDMMQWEEICADPNYDETKSVYSFSSYEKGKAAQQNAPDAKPLLPEEIDVLLLDGGEFSSYGEYKALAGRAKVICLDDSHRAIKNRRVREELLAAEEWAAAADMPNERNGWSVFCRRELLETVAPLLRAAVPPPHP